jgi:hypothetical protein
VKINIKNPICRSNFAAITKPVARVFNILGVDNMQNLMFKQKLFVVPMLASLSMLFGLSGCAEIKQKWMYADYAIKPLNSGKSKLAEIQAMLKQEGITDNCFALDTPSVCKSQRNAAVAGLMTVSDELCLEHVKTIYGNDAAYNLTLGSLTNLFAGAAAVAGTSGAKTLFSSFALFSNAERSLINETVYKNMLSMSVSKKIREGRLEERNMIVKRLRSDEMENYTMNEALSNVIEYHNTCTFMYGLEKALEDGNQNGTELKKLALERQLEKLHLEKQLREKELKTANDWKADDEWIGMNARITALHKAIQSLETFVVPDTENNKSDDVSKIKEPEAKPTK